MPNVSKLVRRVEKLIRAERGEEADALLSAQPPETRQAVRQAILDSAERTLRRGDAVVKMEGVEEPPELSNLRRVLKERQ